MTTISELCNSHNSQGIKSMAPVRIWVAPYLSIPLNPAIIPLTYPLTSEG